jgi:hypothetical protein
MGSSINDVTKEKKEGRKWMANDFLMPKHNHQRGTLQAMRNQFFERSLLFYELSVVL